MDAILANVEKGSTIYSDGLADYKPLRNMEFVHETVNHVTEYVRGERPHQGIENFWSLLKRGHCAAPTLQLSRSTLTLTLTEQVFRFNNRSTKDNPLTDADSFMLAVSQISGKRLTYAELTGKVGETAERSSCPFG